MKLNTDNISHLFVDFDYSQFKSQKHPENKSIITFKEINDLQKLPDDEDFVKEKDDIAEVFKKATKKNNLKYPRKIVHSLIDQSRQPLMNIKNYFNRPRPKVLADSFGLDLKNVELPSMQTPSYPSGHSAQGVLVARVLSEIYPEAQEDFMQEAENISYSRNIGKSHYKSDSDLGKQIGEAMYEHVRDKLFN